MYVNNPGHMTKMATMPIMVKTIQKSFSPELVDRFQRNLARSIDDPVVTLTYFTTWSTFVAHAFEWVKLKMLVELKDLQEIGTWTGY